MKLEELNAHDQKIVSQAVQYLTRQDAPMCEHCGVPHGIIGIIVEAVFETTQGNAESAETLVKEALQRAIRLLETTSAIRSFDPNDRTQRFEFHDAPAFCDDCEKLHSIFDVLAAAVLCGLKTKEELEQAFTDDIAFLQQLIENQTKTDQLPPGS